MAEGKPPVEVELTWDGDLRFRGHAGQAAVVVDSDGLAGPSPVQSLEKGRQPLRGLRAHLRAERAAEDPHRLVRVDLSFEVSGEIAPDKVERAIALSREKYCSVWHSLRPDIEFRTSFEVMAPRIP